MNSRGLGPVRGPTCWRGQRPFRCPAVVPPVRLTRQTVLYAPESLHAQHLTGLNPLKGRMYTLAALVSRASAYPHLNTQRCPYLLQGMPPSHFCLMTLHPAQAVLCLPRARLSGPLLGSVSLFPPCIMDLNLLTTER
jgi:hypothetical protein